MLNLHPYLDGNNILGKRKFYYFFDFNVQTNHHIQNHQNIINFKHNKKPKTSIFNKFLKFSGLESIQKKYDTNYIHRREKNQIRVLQVFQIFKLSLFDFLIDTDTPSNVSMDLRNLMSSNKFINKQLIYLYMQRGIFKFQDILSFHPVKRILAKTIIFKGHVGKKILLQTPIIESLTLIDCRKFLANQFPDTLTELVLISCHVRLIGLKPGILPSSLQDLRLPHNFNNNIIVNLLPKNLTKLQLGNSFDKFIKPFVLPFSLKILIFGDKFNQNIIPNVLPENLIELSFGFNFNKKLNPGVLPQLLKVLNFSEFSKFKQKFDKGSLPINLNKFCLNSVYLHELEKEILPNDLSVLQLIYNYPLKPNILPENLISLDLGPYPFILAISLNILPRGLQSLTISSYYRHSLKNVLPNLTELIFSEIISRDEFELDHIVITPDIFPTSLRKLSFLSRNFNQKLVDDNNVSILPSNLVELTLNYNYNKIIQKEYDDVFLPVSLQKITYDASIILFNKEYIDLNIDEKNERYKNTYNEFITKQLVDCGKCHKWFPKFWKHKDGFSFIWQRKL